MAAYYLAEIRAFQPEGPYYLAGSSFGGLVAFEIARQLECTGQVVGLLALFDTYGPGYGKRTDCSSTPFLITDLYDRARHVWETLKLLKPSERVRFLRTKANKVRKIVRRRRAWKDNEFEIAFNSATGRTLPKDMQRNHKALQKAQRDYKPQIYQGRIVLFRAATQPTGVFPDPTLGWKDLAVGGLEVYEVPGFHGAVTIDPHAKFLAEKLEPCLLLAQSSNGRRPISPMEGSPIPPRAEPHQHI
jgi:aspartate racemase